MNRLPRSINNTLSRSGSAANNIHINISLNVKQKNNCFHGKKIDNFIQLNSKQKDNFTKQNPLDQHQKKMTKLQTKNKTDNSLKSTNKKKTIKKQDKQKPKIKQWTPQKQITQNQTQQKSKNKKQDKSNNKTTKKQGRSKSKTTTKFLNKNSSKSTQNLRNKYNQKRTKQIYSNSNSRQKSQSIKQAKSNTQSLKKLSYFQNSGIKGKVQKFEPENQKQSRASKASIQNKFTKQQLDKIKKFIKQKKIKERKQKIKKQKQLNQRSEKIKSELLKVEAQRRQNATKSFKKQLVKMNQPQQIRFPMFYGEDDQFDEDKDYDKLKQQAQFILKSPLKFSSKNDSAKKRIKSSNSFKKKNNIYEKFLNENLSQFEKVKFIQKIIKIQSMWRGYKDRKKIFLQINKINKNTNLIKNKVHHQTIFWNDEQNNSIIKIEESPIQSQKNLKDISIRSSQILEKEKMHRDRFIQLHSLQVSNYNSGKTEQNNTNHKKYLQNSHSNGALQKYIETSKVSFPQTQSFKEGVGSQQSNSKYLSQIQELRRNLSQQQKLLKNLQEQNLKLKLNLKNVNNNDKNDSQMTLQKQKSDNMNSIQNDLQAQFYELKMPKKISQQESKQLLNKKNNQLESKRLLNKKIDLQIKTKKQEVQPLKLILKGDEGQTTLEDFKKQFQNYESPSNKKIQLDSKLNFKNIEEVFRKKQIHLDFKFKKNVESYSDLLRANVVSPKTFDLKKNQLFRQYQKQKQFINSKKAQTIKVVQFLNKNSQENQIYQQNFCQVQISKIKIQSEIITEENKIRNRSKSIGYKDTKIEQYFDEPVAGDSQLKQQQIQSHLNNYWTDNVEDIHQKALQISRKIDQALQIQKNYQSSRSDPSQEYSSQTSSLCTQSISCNKIQKTDDFSNQRQNLQINKQNIVLEIEDYGVQRRENQQQKGNNRLNIKDINQIDQNKSEGSLQNSSQFAQQNHFQYKKTKNQSLQNSQSQVLYSKNSSQVKIKGFDSRLTFIKQFCISLCQYIRSQSNFKKQFVQAIRVPIKYDYFEFLKAYRTLLSNQNDSSYDSTVNEYIYPYFKILSPKEQTITAQHFASFNQVYQQANSSQSQMNDEVQTMKLYFLTAIVDIFNQALNYEKPGSIYGQSLPWLSTSKNLKNNAVKYLKENQSILKQENSFQVESIQDQKLDKIFGIAISKIIQWGSCLCGFIPEPISIDGEDSQVMNIDEQQTGIVRQNRMAYMLQKSLLQDQQKMIDSQMEQIEVFLQISVLIEKHLQLEVFQEIQNIQAYRYQE